MYVFFIDGKETWRSQGGGVCNQPGYVKVTGEISTEDWAINSWWANNPANATYPDSFLVDYVRVYEVGDYQYPVAIKPHSQNDRIHLFPNPGNEQIIVEWDPSLFDGMPDISIVDATGRVIRSFDRVQNQASLFIDDLSRGTYFLAIKQAETIDYRRFIKY
jgi:hypothetical protein